MTHSQKTTRNLSLGRAVDSVFRHYAQFSGRARRSEYWWWVCFQWINSFVFVVLLLYVENITDVLLLLYSIWSVVCITPTLSVSIRRLHDTGRSGWRLLFGLVPVVGELLLLIWLCEGSDPCANKYGSNPKEVCPDPEIGEKPSWVVIKKPSLNVRPGRNMLKRRSVRWLAVFLLAAVCCGGILWFGMEEKDFMETANGVSFKMVYVRAGTFMMGATPEQENDARDDEKPVRQVTLTKDFYIGECEVTQGLWEAVMGTTVKRQRDQMDTSFYLRGVGPDYPMYYVSWNEAQEFCAKLSQMTGKKYALPTEAQWEYAARGGRKSDGNRFSGSDNVDKVAWYDVNSGNTTHPVATKKANALGIYDMSGNVNEWCSDRYGPYSSTPQTDPAGSSTGSDRVYRGGSWRNNPRHTRISYRDGYSPESRNYNRGFRVVYLP